MASVTAVDSQKNNRQVGALTPVPEEEGESAFEAPPGMQRWLEEKILQSSSSSLVSTVTDTTEEDNDEEHSGQHDKAHETLVESLPPEEREKIRVLLSKTADSSAIKERLFSTQIRPPPTPPQDVSMYTNTRRTARSKRDRESGFNKSDYLVEALLQSQPKNREDEVEKQNGKASHGVISGNEYEVPVHIQDNSSSDSGEESRRQTDVVVPSNQAKETEFPKLGQFLSRNAWASLKSLLDSFFSVEVAQYYWNEYIQRLPQVVGYTFAGVGFLYCLFGFLFLLLAVGGLVGWFLFCAIIVSAVVSCILLIGLVVFVVCFLCVCTFSVSLFTVLFAANSLFHHTMADKRKLYP